MFLKIYKSKQQTKNMVQKQRVLIQFDACPYCQNAKKHLDEAGIDYIKLTINPNDRSIVKALSGQESVPILAEVIGANNQDDDIIEYIKELKQQD